tara:strand:- start:372 stop:548 length:177 start_codon:yes stop_codon:yes gene_type:complete
MNFRSIIISIAAISITSIGFGASLMNPPKATASTMYFLDNHPIGIGSSSIFHQNKVRI